MAKTKAQKAVEAEVKRQLEANEGAADLLSDEEEADDADTLSALAEMGGPQQVTWQVFRTMPADKAGYLTSYTSAELSLERIKTDCGPGRYRVRGKTSKGQFAGQETISIADLPKPAAPAAPAAAPGSALEIVALLREERERNSIDWKFWGPLLVPVLAPIVGNLFGNKGQSLAELTTALRNMKELSGESQPMAGQFDQFVKVVELAKSIGGDDKGTGSNWLDVLRDIASSLGPVAKEAIINARTPRLPDMGGASVPSAPQVQVPPRESLGAHPGAAQPLPPNTEEQNTMLAMVSFMRSKLTELVDHAANNRDPGFYGEWFADQIPDGMPLGLIHENLNREDWWPSLCSFVPAVQPYPAWFKEMRAELLLQLESMIAEEQGESAQKSPQAPAAPLATKDKQTQGGEESA